MENMGNARAKKFKALLDMLDSLMPDSEEAGGAAAGRSWMDELEADNQNVLHALAAALCSSAEETAAVKAHLEGFLATYPSDVDR
jgi:hypothetical protein